MKKLFGTVETTSYIPCTAKDAWRTVCFYEHVQARPSWFLRTVLPVPEATTGCYGNVGDESRCMYSDGGYLAKKITAIIQGNRIDFDITEQTIRYSDSVVLKGGTIEVAQKDAASCAVRMLTRYELKSPWLVLLRPFVAFTVAAMHRFVMRDMLTRLSSHKLEFVHRRDADATVVNGTPLGI